MAINLAQDTLKKLENSRKSSWAPHYFFRRLPLMGTALFLPSLIVILFSYLGVSKDDALKISDLDWVHAIEKRYSILICTTHIASLVAILGFNFGGAKYFQGKLSLNGLALAIALLPFLLPIDDIRYRIFFTFIWGIVLTILSWQANRTFGYTRIWARSEYYTQRLTIIEWQQTNHLIGPKSADAKRAEVIRQWHKEIYTDTVGDTFHFWERLTQK